MSADERAAIANNSHADLFVSIHFNAALAPSVSGAEVYYVSLDREGEEALKTSQATTVKVPAAAGATRTIDFIRWDMAQARHVEFRLQQGNAKARAAKRARGELVVDVLQFGG